jgi:hypothetical protein
MIRKDFSSVSVPLGSTLFGRGMSLSAQKETLHPTSAVLFFVFSEIFLKTLLYVCLYESGGNPYPNDQAWPSV